MIKEIHSFGSNVDLGTVPTAHQSTFDNVVPEVEKCLYLTNLHWWTTDRNVEELCATYGKVKKVRFLEEKTNGKSKGSAFVQFWISEDSAKAFQGLNGTYHVTWVINFTFIH